MLLPKQECLLWIQAWIKNGIFKERIDEMPMFEEEFEKL